MSEQATLPAKWTPDCQGKWDFDGDIVCLTTRYWPRGGGCHTFSVGAWAGNESRPTIKPHAHAEIVFHTEYDVASRIGETLIEARFEGEDETEVKSMVERWAEAQYHRVIEVLKSEFQKAAP